VSREALVECDDAFAFRTVSFVANDAVRKVAATGEHRDPGFGGGTLDFDRTYGGEAAEDVDNLGATVSVCPLQHPDQFAQDYRRHDYRVRPFDRARGFAGLPFIVPCQITDKNIRIDSDSHRSSPASIASCISSSDTGRCPGRRNAPRRL